ncbi:MAG: hypothetical protein ACRC5M_04740 [Anaeroplasmataceae bacterium]
MNNENSPNFKLGLPFDNVNIIFNTLIGEPRYQFRTDDGYPNNLIAHNKDCDKAFEVLFDTDVVPDKVLEYAEEAITLPSLLEFGDYGKLFYNYGIVSLDMISLLLTKPKYGAKEVSTIRVTMAKLESSLERNYSKFLKIIGVYDRDTDLYNSKTDGSHIFNYNLVGSKLERAYENYSLNRSYECSFSSMFSATYASLVLYLTGLLITSAERFGLTCESLYSEGSEIPIESFGDRLISSNVMESDVKYKLLSLIYTVYKMHKFYSDRLGFDISDKLSLPFVIIGEKISKLDLDYIEKELDISYLTQSKLLNRESRATMMSLLETVNVITQPSVFDNYLLDYETVNVIACGVYEYITTRYFSEDDSGDKKPGEIVPFYDCMTDCGSVTTTDIDILYNHFIDNVVDTIPASISPKFFYQLTVYAAAFYKLKEKESIQGKDKEKSSLGYYQAMGVISYLYRKWFVSDRSYPVSTGITADDIRYAYFKTKAHAYAIISLQMLSDTTSTTPDCEMSINNCVVSLGDIMNTIHVLSSSSSKEDKGALSYICEGMKNILIEHSKINDYSVRKNPGEDDLYEYLQYINEDSCNFAEAINKFNKQNIDITKLITTTLEVDYPAVTMSKLAEYGEEVECEYNCIYNSKLARVLANNLSAIESNRKVKDNNFDIIFNVFVKCIIPMYMAKQVADKSMTDEEDKLNFDIEDKIIPNIRSNSSFNFLENH